MFKKIISAITSRSLGLGVLGLVIVVDQLTKTLILGNVSALPMPVIPNFLTLTLAWNNGMSFSFLADFIHAKFVLSAIAIVASIFFIYWMNQHNNTHKKAQIFLHQSALGLITGGALGNVLDRFQHDAVVDFLHLHFNTTTLFVFNGADTFIFIGVALLFCDALLDNKTRKENKGKKHA